MARLIGVNTLVFMEELNEKVKKQWEYFPDLKQIGFPFVEVRREFFQNVDDELEQTARKASEYDLTLYYSVPDVLFVDGEVNPHLRSYFDEAAKLAVLQVKLTLGTFYQWSDAVVDELKQILSEYPTIQLSIENDQSTSAGSAKNLAQFAVEVHEQDLPIKLTFDTGNFVYIQEDPEESARILQEFVGYIHIKNVRINAENDLELALYDTGDINLKPVLHAFRENVVAAIEYPCGPSEHALQVLKEELAFIQAD